jgi:hypothetical protein
MATSVSGQPTVKIFGWWQRANRATAPHDFCVPEAARNLVQLGLAKLCLKGFAVQLLRPPSDLLTRKEKRLIRNLEPRKPRFPKQRKFIQITIRGLSCKMGPRVTEEAADGSICAMTAVEAYLMIFAGSYCPLVPSQGIFCLSTSAPEHGLPGDPESPPLGVMKHSGAAPNSENEEIYAQ